MDLNAPRPRAGAELPHDRRLPVTWPRQAQMQPGRKRKVGPSPTSPKMTRDRLKFSGKGVLDAPVGDQVDRCDKHIYRDRYPRADKRQRDCRHVEKGRYFAFDIAAERFGQHRGGAMCANDRPLQQRPGDPRQQQREAIDCGRERGEVVFAHPPCRKRDQRQPEQQIVVAHKIGPLTRATVCRRW